MTIVPTSEVNPSGEVSYVLIVSQPDSEEKSDPADLSVFDFKEERGLVGTGVEGEGVGVDEGEDGAEGMGASVGGETPGTKKGLVKFNMGGRTRTVTQLMCNYCNYTSPKR